MHDLVFWDPDQGSQDSIELKVTLSLPFFQLGPTKLIERIGSQHAILSSSFYLWTQFPSLMSDSANFGVGLAEREKDLQYFELGWGRNQKICLREAHYLKIKNLGGQYNKKLRGLSKFSEGQIKKTQKVALAIPIPTPVSPLIGVGLLNLAGLVCLLLKLI